MEKNQLEIIVKDSGLEQTKAQYLLENFQEYFAIADEWEKKAKGIIVTSDTQKVEMQMARVGRLFLRDKRISIEKARKELKEQSLREGKAIDGISNVLKALIVPIEKYLEEQERFVEIREKARLEMERIENEKRLEEERLAKEKAEREEQERIRKENEKLKQEASEREKQAIAERLKHEKTLQREREKAERERTKAEIEKKAIEEEARKKQEIVENNARLEREKIELEKKAIEDKARKEKEIEMQKANDERIEKERLAELLRNQIECPFCHKKFQIKR